MISPQQAKAKTENHLKRQYEAWLKAPKPTHQNFDGIERKLTTGEILMASKVFKGSIIYQGVRVIRGRLLGLPNATNNAMTPFGNMHFPNYDYDKNLDFSMSANSGDKIWFIHEMAHIWQRQMGRMVAGCGLGTAITGGYSGLWNAYSYDLLGSDKDKQFHQFHFEQQADLIAHYFSLNFLNQTPANFDIRQKQALYDVLEEFIKNPSNKNLISSYRGGSVVL